MIYVEKDPLKNIAAFVTAFHVVLLGAFLWVAPMVPATLKPKQIIVQTVQLSPKLTAAPVKASPTKSIEKNPVKNEIAVAEAKPEVKPKVKPLVKPEPKPALKAAPKPQVKPVAKPAAKTPAKPIAKPAVKSEVKAVAEAPKKNVPSKAALDAIKSKLAAIPSSTVPAEVKAEVGEQAYGYEEELVTRLKILLKLPEMGDVKVSLTLNRQGKVVKTEILSSASALNRKAVETHLPAIQFPSFGQAFAGENTHTFILTLTNL